MVPRRQVRRLVQARGVSIGEPPTEPGENQLLLKTAYFFRFPRAGRRMGVTLSMRKSIRPPVADLFALPVGQPDSHPLVLADTPANEDQGQFSPDGRWVAYTSNESGLSEIYVIPFPPAPEWWPMDGVPRRRRTTALAA